jgi:hypothetical protein
LGATDDYGLLKVKNTKLMVRVRAIVFDNPFWLSVALLGSVIYGGMYPGK